MSSICRIPVKLRFIILISALCLSFTLFSCKQKHSAEEPQIVTTPEQMNSKVSDNLKAVLAFAKDNNGNISDSLKVFSLNILDGFYSKNNYKAIWSTSEKWLPEADTIFDFIQNAALYGLYPSDYHYYEMEKIRKGMNMDSLSRENAAIWTKADLLMTDAYFHILKDMYEGRLVDDSVSIIQKKSIIDSFFVKKLQRALDSNRVGESLLSVEPTIPAYQELRGNMKDFVQKMDTSQFLHVKIPYQDTLAFYLTLHRRLLQGGIGDSSAKRIDSIIIRKEIRKYQEREKLKVDGKPGPEVVNSLNFTDNEKFKRIAITLDRYKQLRSLPATFIWVNIPAFKLKVYKNDTIVLESKVIVGKPDTRTPVLKSAITDMVTFPQWTIPESIIKKDILPALKKNPGYLRSKGFSLVGSDGETVDPFSVDWKKYKTGIPWKVVQGSGDDNALGIFKFNFNNPYSVYLHDTNQRYLFGNTYRALSHGCVRVQKWKDLALIISDLDSSYLAKKDRKPSYNLDSLNTWLKNNNRKRIMVYNRIPVYIQYFTCEDKDDKIIFYNDIYSNDEYLAEKYFKHKHF
ncbi:MAG: L,D-transpeptidase family protein [Bacteroidetes bacterium]|nr:L,D-transpeptidase family protein [Bacteroidota bacterium]